MLANIFLHYVLDLWFDKRVVPRVPGSCHLVRYADDFLILVQDQEQAQRIEKALRQRLAEFGLTLHPDKTRTISFGRYEREPRPNGKTASLTRSSSWALRTTVARAERV